VGQPGQPAQPNAQPKNKTPKEVGRPTGATASYSQKAIQETVYAIEDLRVELNKSMKKKMKKRKLTEVQSESIDQLVQSIVLSSDKQDWNNIGMACIQDFSKISELGIIQEISEISSEHELSEYPSAILFHSKKKD